MIHRFWKILECKLTGTHLWSHVYKAGARNKFTCLRCGKVKYKEYEIWNQNGCTSVK